MDLLQALGAETIPPESDGWYTVRELRRLLNLSADKIYQRLSEMDEDGRLEHVKVLRRNLAGDLRPTPAYRLKECAEG